MGRSNINLVGNTTQGQNIGVGDCVFKDKVLGNTLQFKSLSVTGTTMVITTDDNNIYFSANTGGGGGTSYWSSGATGLYPSAGEDIDMNTGKIYWNTGVCLKGTGAGATGQIELLTNDLSYRWLFNKSYFGRAVGGDFQINVHPFQAGTCYVSYGFTDEPNSGLGRIYNSGQATTVTFLGDNGCNHLYMHDNDMYIESDDVYFCSLPAKTSETNVIYVDSDGKISSGATGGGGGLTSSSNGLTDDGTTVCLGGTVTNAVTIDGSSAGQTITLKSGSGTVATYNGVSASQAILQYNDSASSTQFRAMVSASGIFMDTFNSGSPGTPNSLFYSPTIMRQTVAEGNAMFEDLRGTTKGLEYCDNYCAGFTARSLIDKGYADSRTTGTTNYLAKFGSSGNCIEDSAIIDNGTDLCLKCSKVYIGCDGANVILKATDAPTQNSCMIISPGTCTSWSSGGHRDGYVYIDTGCGSPTHPLYIGSPTNGAFAAFIQPAGSNSNIAMYLCAKGSGGRINALAGSSSFFDFGVTTSYLSVCTGGILKMTSYCDLTIQGASTSASSSNGKSVYICGGSATGDNNPDGGDVILSGGAGNGTGGSGRIALCGLPSKNTETCVVWIDSSGNLSTATPSSDIRLKCNIEPIKSAVSLLDDICGYSAEFNELSNCHGCCEYVFIAQEVEKDLPLAVKNGVLINDVDYKKVEYDQLVPVLWNIVKEQEARIKALEDRINL